MPTEYERPDPRLILKATPPKASRSALPRERLGSAAPRFDEKSVVAVTASPGYGKTALLAQWRREAIATGASVAWLTIDQWDDGPRLLQGLRLALRVAMGRPPTQADHRVLEQYDDPSGGISTWLAEVAAHAGEVLLILDDVHWLPDTAQGALAFLLHHPPSNLRILLASRKSLPFPVSDLIARGTFAAIEKEALQLRMEETAALLQARFGNRVDPDLCARIHQLTEGWPLGLQLLIASMDKQPSIREAVATCMAHSGDLHRYFVETLLQRLKPDDVAFLVAVSFADALHPDLCRAITGRDDSPAVLAQLQALTPFLSEGVEGGWLRIHALARDFLLELFEALPEATRCQYYAAAALWLSANGFDEEAARHALRSGQEELALDLAERSLYEVYRTGQVSRIAQWLDRLATTQLARRPRLRIALGWALAKNDRNAEASVVVGPIIDDPLADIADRFEAILVMAAAAMYTDRLDDTNALLAPWREGLGRFNPILRQVTANLEGILTLHRGSPEQARYLVTQLAGQASAAGRYATGARDWLLGTSYLWQGQVIPAEQSLRVSLAEVEPVAGRRSPIATMLAATLAAVRWERDAPDEIQGLLADRWDVIDQYTMPDVIAASYIVAARCANHGGAMHVAYEQLERLHAIGKTRAIPRLCVASLAEQMRLSALQGRVQSCVVTATRLQQAAADFDARRPVLVKGLVDIQLHVADAYHCIARQDWQQAREALAQARPLAEKLRRNKDQLQIHFLDALAARNLGQDMDAMFREGLFIVETLGLKRLLADTHPALLDWDQRMRNPEGMLERTVRPAAVIPAVRPELAQVSPNTLLTPKEREILRLLNNNLSNKEIAMALDVSVQTVKWHLKNLFGKLNAGSRRHLLDRARQMGLFLD